MTVDRGPSTGYLKRQNRLDEGRPSASVQTTKPDTVYPLIVTGEQKRRCHIRVVVTAVRVPVVVEEFENEAYQSRQDGDAGGDSQESREVRAHNHLICNEQRPLTKRTACGTIQLTFGTKTSFGTSS